ncbi:myeloid-associated differentiation marker-like [Neosynchiropus ocellatus]
MIQVNLRSLKEPLGLMRIGASFFTCLTFSLAATAQVFASNPYWAWCMFTWCFCFIFTLTIVVMEFTTFSTKVPFSWEDFTSAFAMLASLMCLAASIIYPTFFTCTVCHRAISATVISWLCFITYTAEVVYTRLLPRGQVSGFLSTIPGIMKMLEAFLACLIFTSLETNQYQRFSGLQWCVAVYSLCFIFAIVIILLSVTQLTKHFPLNFDFVAIAYNVLSALMYVTVMVIWPLYSFRNNARPPDCGRLCPWDKLVFVTFMAIFNTIVYTLDSIYTVRLVFFNRVVSE